MRFEIPALLALLSNVASTKATTKATTSKVNNVKCNLPAFNDQRGATIFTTQGCGTGTDGFAIPGNSSFCTDLDNVFANVDGQVRSIRIEKNYQCEFFLGYGCPAYGSYLTYGNTTMAVAVNTLPANFDNKIHSIWCCAL